MSGARRDRWWWLALAGIAVGGVGLRVAPFLGSEGAWGAAVDYDEGVYFSAAASLLEGAWPWRDFVFVHPPGHLVFLAVTSAWTKVALGVAGAFAVSRWLAAMIGIINVLLVGHLVARSTGNRVAGILSAALYATYPEVVQVERGPFLEPLLNLVCLSLVIALMRASEEERTARAVFLSLAGLCAGLALSIKLWALLWWLGAAVALRGFGSTRDAFVFFRAATVTALVVLAPFVLRAPDAFLTEVVRFHAWRPPDGLIPRWARLEQIVALRHLASPLLAALFVALTVGRPGRAKGVAPAVLVVVWPLTLGAFFLSASYWAQYNAHLAASEAVLAGLAVSRVTTMASSRARPAAWVVLTGFVVVSVTISIVHVVRRSQRSVAHLALARSPLRDTPGCVFTFEPGWSLAANRLPPRLADAPLLIDPYAAQLLELLREGRRFASVDEAFASSQTLPPLLSRCEVVVLGARGERQLSARAIELLAQTHQRTDLWGLSAWERRAH